MPVTCRAKPVLIVEDDETISGLLALLLKQNGIESGRCYRVAEGRELNSSDFDLAIVDLGLPDGDGVELLQHFRRQDPEFPMLVLSGHDRAEDALRALRAGANDYLTKPFERSDLIDAVMRARERARAEPMPPAAPAARENAATSAGRSALADYPSPVMRHTAGLVARAAASEVPVLLTGETGSGKGVMAREIHRLSRRAAGPLQLVTCPAIPKDLAEAELFGHEKGAFTGAVSARKGRIEAADGGTLFLDEIGDLQTAIQPKLLEVLQSGTFSRVGGTEARSSDFRLISATNVSLRAAVDAKTFREDLFFRINLFEIRLPALRERTEDLPLLCRAILDRFEPPSDRETWEISTALHEWLAGYHWPGNIRQLENVLGRMTLVASSGVLGVEDLPMESVTGDSGGVSGDELRAALVRGQALEDIERAALIAALENSGGNRKRAARILGVSLRTVYNMIDRFGLPKRSTSGKTAE